MIPEETLPLTKYMPKISSSTVVTNDQLSRNPGQKKRNVTVIGKHDQSLTECFRGDGKWFYLLHHSMPLRTLSLSPLDMKRLAYLASFQGDRV